MSCRIGIRWMGEGGAPVGEAHCCGSVSVTEAITFASAKVRSALFHAHTLNVDIFDSADRSVVTCTSNFYLEIIR